MLIFLMEYRMRIHITDSRGTRTIKTKKRIYKKKLARYSRSDIYYKRAISMSRFLSLKEEIKRQRSIVYFYKMYDKERYKEEFYRLCELLVEYYNIERN